MSVVRVIESCVLTFNGEAVPMRQGAAFDADEPIVLAFPEVFRRDNADEIESATAGPGERRNTRRP